MTKRKPQDPNFEREAQKYDNPIPSRELIMEMLADEGEPMSMKRVAEALGLESETELEALRRRLRAMERDGQLVRNRRDRFGLVSKMQLISGRVIAHPDGFGFLVPDDGGDDLFLSARQMRTLLHGDRALARVSGVDRRGRREGTVVEVLERANNEVVGRFMLEHGIGFVAPDNKRITQDILIPPEGRGGASSGQIVVARIIEQPSNRAKPIGEIVEVLGDHMAPGMEIDIAIRAHELPREWPPEVKDEIRVFGREVEEAHKADREDLRDLPLVTIDGEDARDFDDAVYCERQGKGWRLLVAIADVSHYVDFDSALDKEGRTRGNSVYFPGRVIPMLPEVLSNGLCSLNPKTDRLCMVCEMELTAAGAVRDFRFFEGLMRSSARLTYNEVATMVVERDMALRREHQQLVPHLDNLHELYKVFRARRDKRGAIDFETTETRIVFGTERKIDQIVPVERNDAHKLIEEFMIAANVCAAKFLLDNKIPALYRVHQGPSEEKLTALREFLSSVGLTLGGGDEPEPKHYAKILDQLQGRPDAHLIQTVLLRSLRQAVYTPENNGHFGLAFDAYAHFTSPIRRYPDLLVHRAIRHVVRGKPVKQYKYGMSDMLAFGEHCSMTERRADEATRDAVDWLKCEYMQDRVGEEYDGIISSVTGFGLFVELDDIYVEGLVHITSLAQDYYQFDPVHHRLIGERSNKVYGLAGKIRVKVARVDLERKRIDFELAESELEAGAKGAPKKKKSSRQRKRGKGDAAKPAAAESEAPKKKKSRRKRSRKKSPK
ncbi:exoribonuclease R [Candidatus Tenderia electrophaga]|jgi:ribonuclease R|uniref:Ribonuclease R n=1 Tax=Candidatus Tenderia electrophaga TaxID=1748243 RepID=A0A0S2TCY1_9GAMM|nr:exoribonuclease R [Candidatus Tenderia electrophaga]